ncbi:MAG: FG-GAP repeat protein [Planctomycetes bacterium]|nr:FG-GAP repeat protein [Planctomycetota bacterium]
MKTPHLRSRVLPVRRASLLGLALFAPLGVATAQSALLSYEGDFHGAEFGSVLRYAFVADGDGIPDILVGCPEDDSAGEDAGAVYVFSGADHSLLRKHVGSAAGDRFGSALALCGHVDNDIYLDYAIGAPFSDANGVDAGSVVICSGLDGHVLATQSGAAAGDRFGSSIGYVGEYDDGIDPFVGLAIGAPYFDGTAGSHCGAVFFRRALGGLLPYPPFERQGTQANEHFGASLDARTESGYHGIIIGAPDFDGGIGGTNAGRFEVWLAYKLETSPFAAFEFTVLGTAPNGRLGSSVAAIHWPDAGAQPPYLQYAAGAPEAATPYVEIWSDHSTGPAHLATLTGSGRFGASIACSDPTWGASLVAIGSPDQASAKGRVTIYKDGVFDRVVDGQTAGEHFGACVAGHYGATEVDFHEDELLFGSPDAIGQGPSGAVPSAGRLEQHDYFHKQYGLSAPLGAGDRAGSAVAGLGDVDADGVPDVLVGSPDDDRTLSVPVPSELIDCGSVRVLSGATGAVLRTTYGAADGDHLGASVAALGDIDLDGVTDYVAGAPQQDNTSTTKGYAYAISGKTGAILFTLSGFFNSGEFGAAVGGGSDVNGDGRMDILVGSPGTSNGNVTAYSGVNGASLGTVNGATVGDRFGAAVAGLGADLNGDGRQEYLVGAPGFDLLGTVDAGRAYLMRSTTSLLTVNVANGFAANDRAGTSVSAVGDVNHDGVADWLVGIPGYDTPATDAGRVRVISGVAGLGTQLASITGLGPDDQFGTSVVGVGDVDLDGFVDWAAGAPEQLVFSVDGYVRVISGKDASQLFLLDGASGDGYGSALASAGDVDLDGIRDLVVGSPDNGHSALDGGRVEVVSLSSGTPAWTDLGFALAGLAGPPSLVGTGSLLGGSPGALTLTAAAPSALCFLFVSLSSTPSAFKGGILATVPVDASFALGTSATGELPIAWAAWQPGLSGLVLSFQYGIKDVGGPYGVALSNAVQASVP